DGGVHAGARNIGGDSAGARNIGAGHGAEPTSVATLERRLSGICWHYGDAARLVQNCTLSRFALERAGNITQRSERIRGVCGGPDVIAGQGDMLPAEGRNMGEEAVGDIDASGAQM